MYLCNAGMEIDGGCIVFLSERFVCQCQNICFPALRFYPKIEISRIMPSSNTQSNTSSGQLLDVPSNGSSATESLDESKKELQQSLDKADKLVNKLGKDETLTLTGRKLLSALSKAVDSGQKLIENSNIKDSKYYKAAKVTLDEAIDVAENWVDRQASKAQ